MAYAEVLPNPHGLRVHELANTVPAQLPAVATAFDAAEGQPRVRRHHAVYEHVARLDPTRQDPCFLDVTRPQGGPETGNYGSHCD